MGVRLTADNLVRLSQCMDRVSANIDALGEDDSAFAAIEHGQLGESMRSLTRELDHLGNRPSRPW